MTNEKSLFQEVVGSSPNVKVIEYFLEWRGFDITMTDINRGSGVSRTTLYKVLENLTSKGIIENTRKVGTAEFYKMNKKHQITKSLIKLFNSIIKHNLNLE